RTRIHPWPADNFVTDPNNADRFSNEYVGIPMNRVFNTILQSMGLTPADYENNSINTYFQGRTDGHYGAVNNGIARMGGYGHWGPHYASASGWHPSQYVPRQALFNLHHFKSV